MIARARKVVGRMTIEFSARDFNSPPLYRRSIAPFEDKVYFGSLLIAVGESFASAADKVEYADHDESLPSFWLIVLQSSTAEVLKRHANPRRFFDVALVVNIAALNEATMKPTVPKIKQLMRIVAPG